jgi:hypothetical protein
MSDTAGNFAAYTLDSIFMQAPDGLVYRAHRSDTGEAVLLKVPAMPEEWEEAARFRDRYMARANGVRSLRHPGILGVREIGHDEASGMPFIAYEVFEGKDLRELTARGRRVPDADLAMIGASVAEALDHAHAAGFVHGSLSPAAIIVGPDGSTRLAGFGIEPPPGSPTDMRGHAVGSGSYSAPEQIIGGLVDGRSDLFALGLVLFEAVTGQHPFLATPPRDVRDRIVQDEAPLPNKIRPETPGGFNTILFKLLQKDPSKRPARGAEVAQALRALHERLLHPPAPVAPPAAAAASVPAPAPAAHRAAARPGASPVAIAAVAAVVLLAAVAGVLVMRRPAPPPAAPVAAVAPTVSPAAIEQVAVEVEAAIRAEDFRRAERLLSDLRRDAPLEPAVLDLGQRIKTLRAAKVDRLLSEGVALARQAKWREAERRFNAVLEIDPANVDARDRLDELADRLTPSAAGGGSPSRGAEPAAVLQKPTPTPVPRRLLHVLFRSPLARGEVIIAVDRRPLPPIAFDFPPGDGASGPLGTVQRSFEMPQGSHHILVAVHNERGNTIGEQALVLKFEPGREHRITIDMATAKSMPRFTASELH